MSDTIIVVPEVPETVEALLSSQFDCQFLRSAQLTPREIAGRCSEASVLVVGPGIQTGQELIACLPKNIGLIASYSAGVDHIDLAAAKQKGLQVSNTPDVLSEATADIALYLILATMRGTRGAEQELRAGEWSGWSPRHIHGTDLFGKKLGVFGFGRIGQATARRALAFGMKVLYHSRKPKSERLVPGAEFVGKLDDFLAEIDVLSLHAPATAETKKFVSEANIAKMKDGVVIINTARGDLVCDDSLMEGLRTGKVSAAGLDVFNGEPNFDERYLAFPQVNLLPHIGSSTAETRLAMGEIVAQNIAAFLAGRELPNEVI